MAILHASVTNEVACTCFFSNHYNFDVDVNIMVAGSRQSEVLFSEAVYVLRS
jgi:hypothetical protein